jgi:hypothetical protein
MVNQINTQIRSTIKGDVVNKFKGKYASQNSNRQIVNNDNIFNSQVESRIGGNVSNEFDGGAPEDSKDQAASSLGRSVHFVWKNISPLNALLQLLTRIFHHGAPS